LTSIARGRGTQDRVLRTAARGAVLIGVAVVIGIVLLQVVDEGGSIGGPPSSSGTRTTSTTGANARPPQEVHVQVLNASGLPGDAMTTANTLKGLGYQIVGTGNSAATQTGTTVTCRAGYGEEAKALASAVAPTGGATVVDFPPTPPAGAETANCIVVKGK